VENTLRFIDLFAGIGGFRLALESSGCECVFSSEWDLFAQKTYKANFGETPKGDITKIATQEIPNFDILTAGFPCQPFSNIGKREGFEHPTQGTLFYDVARILKEKKPKAFILENVEGLVSHDKGRTFDLIISSLALSVNGQSIMFPQENLGYHVFWKVLDAKDYGLPQKRKRIFIVGISSEYSAQIPNFEFPKSHEKEVFINQFIEEGMRGYSISEHLQKTYIYKKNDGRPEV
jgi:DNA (cytosine-5)-methyltransferase 1